MYMAGVCDPKGCSEIYQQLGQSWLLVRHGRACWDLELGNMRHTRCMGKRPRTEEITVTISDLDNREMDVCGKTLIDARTRV